MGQEFDIRLPGVTLRGELDIPAGAQSIVIFSHGSGSSRKSPRNQMVAKILQLHGIGTLLFDLLTEAEESNYYNRFDINLLAQRLMGVTNWLISHEKGKHWNLGYFGASTGAAAALRAAAEFPDIRAVVSRGGRPDLAIESLTGIKAAILLIVGSMDKGVLELNEIAYTYLRGERKLKIVEGASHLFEEAGTLEIVADEAVQWFHKYLEAETNRFT